MRCVRGPEAKSGQTKVRLGRRINGPARALDAMSTDPAGEVAYAWMNRAQPQHFKKKFTDADARPPNYTSTDPRKSKGDSGKGEWLPDAVHSAAWLSTKVDAVHPALMITARS